MKKIYLFTIALLAMMSFVACSSDDEREQTVTEENTETQKNDTLKGNGGGDDIVYMLPKTRAMELTSEQKSMVTKNNDFAFNLYRGISASKDMAGKSNITSPLSLSFLLGMLNDGAQGKTAEEIAALMGFASDKKQDINTFFKTLMEETPKVDQNVSVKIANMVASRNDVELESVFKQDMTDYYSATLPQLNFADKKGSADYVNNWAKEQTDGLVTNVIGEDEISEQTLLMLLNAICLNATWTNKFDEKATKEEAFSGAQKNIPMMQAKAAISYARNDVFSMVSLPYGSGDKWSMKVLLPNEGKTVSDIIGRLSTATWKQDCQQMDSYIVDLKLPRFTTSTDIVLNDIVSGMGAATMFSPTDADFSPLTVNWKKSAERNIYVSLMKQVAKVEVDETGAKMAAVSITAMEAAAMPITREATFHANRPFVYIVEEASSGAVFFIGTFVGE